MIAPLDKLRARQNDIIQIIVTRKCNLFTCSNCTQLLPFRRDPAEMSPAVFRAALRSLDGWPGVRAMFGGNPTTHSQFPELCQILREEVPDQRQRGIWCNDLMEHAQAVRETFWPHGRHNLNVHADFCAADQMRLHLPGWKIWGEHGRVHHAPILMERRDYGVSDAQWLRLRENCDINQHWSAAIAERDGQAFAYFCEVGASLDGVRGENHGIPAEPGWWKLGMPAFADQVSGCCDRGCGVPLRRRGSLDRDDTYDISPAWASLTVRGKAVVKLHAELPAATHEVTDYVNLRGGKQVKAAAAANG